MTVTEWIKKQVLKITGLSKINGPDEQERLTFINNDELQKKTKIREYNVWYAGDSDELLNFYTRQMTIDYNFEPWYSRNKKNYFWSISSTENDIKRTHSGQPRNIVDTLVSIMKFPKIRAASLPGKGKENPLDERLQTIIKESNLKKVYKNQQMPMTLVEGWGCYKINWDMDISDYPLVVYYRAENVDYIMQQGKITGIIFKDYYLNAENNRRYLLTETRRLKYDAVLKDRVLVIEKELFLTSGKSDDDFLTKVELAAVPELSDVVDYIEIGPMKWLLAVPTMFFENTSSVGLGPGRSIFSGKTDLFDDLDQCLSQASNTVRRSTPMEYFDTNYLERDKHTGMPKQPHVYDRKYTMVHGQLNADGSGAGGNPVQVTQPQLDFKSYSDQAVQILLQIINGVLSPATLGIDIAKKDNAEAQREKEKVTIFTRNSILDVEAEILHDLCTQLMCAYEFMHEGKITKFDYDIAVRFSEFADDSYENKLEKLGDAFGNELISEEMYLEKLYGDTLSDHEYERELDWLRKYKTEPRAQGMTGASGNGANLEGMFDEEDDEEGLQL